jgi:hypothetical protein
VAAVDKQLIERDEFLTEIKERLIQSQVTMKSYQDQKRREVVFQEGDWVWLKLPQRAAVGITAPTHSKLGPKYYGPYQVMQKVGEATYKLNFQAEPEFMMSFMFPS